MQRKEREELDEQSGEEGEHCPPLEETMAASWIAQIGEEGLSETKAVDSFIAMNEQRKRSWAQAQELKKAARKDRGFFSSRTTTRNRRDSETMTTASVTQYKQTVPWIDRHVLEPNIGALNCCGYHQPQTISAELGNPSRSSGPTNEAGTGRFRRTDEAVWDASPPLAGRRTTVDRASTSTIDRKVGFGVAARLTKESMVGFWVATRHQDRMDGSWVAASCPSPFFWL